MKKIAFVWYGESTFIQQDFNILQKHFEVVPVRFDCLAKVYDIYKAVKHTDISFCWFADVWSFITVVSAKLFKKKSIVVVGGYDVECMKEIDYGMCTKPWWRKWMRTYTLRHATMVLAVSEYTTKKTVRFMNDYHLNPQRIEVVYNGVDTNYFKPKGEKENIVLTVASGGNNDIIALKGLDEFVKIAKYLRSTKFVIVGLDEKTRYELSKIAISDNIKLIGKLSQYELLKWYQRAKVYCQLSKVESFGMSLAEAMACGCVPIITNVGALFEVVDYAGYVVSHNDEEIAKDIKKALALYNETTTSFLLSEHIKRNFSIVKRERKLVEIIEGLTKKEVI